jgi:trehalose-6-phosphate synthase
LTIEQELKESMNKFIKENSLSHISELHIPPFIINEWNIKKMEDGMNRSISTGYDEKGAEMRKLMKTNLDFTPTVKTKITINKISG